jgi:hypothetical protein
VDDHQLQSDCTCICYSYNDNENGTYDSAIDDSTSLQLPSLVMVGFTSGRVSCYNRSGELIQSRMLPPLLPASIPATTISSSISASASASASTSADGNVKIDHSGSSDSARASKVNDGDSGLTKTANSSSYPADNRSTRVGTRGEEQKGAMLTGLMLVPRNMYACCQYSKYHH